LIYWGQAGRIDHCTDHEGSNTGHDHSHGIDHGHDTTDINAGHGIKQKHDQAYNTGRRSRRQLAPAVG
jgi:hypothetical protein